MENSENKPAQPTSVPFKSADKRYIPRWEVDNRILYSLNRERKERECRSKDLSCVGACIHTRENIPEDQKLKLKVFLSENTCFDVEARILWKKSTQDGYALGVAFDNITPEVQELILTYAFEVKRDDLVKHWFDGWA